MASSAHRRDLLMSSETSASITPSAWFIGRLSTICMSRLLSRTRTVFECSLSRFSPIRAFLRLVPDSMLNGMVAIEITIEPAFWAYSAMTGAAPVPVPPPMPVMMKVRSTSLNMPQKRLAQLRAHCSPTSGRPPAPRPWVSSPRSARGSRTWCP